MRNSFFTNNFCTRKIEHRRCSHRDASEYILFDPKRSMSKFDLTSKSRGHPKRSCYISSDASRREKRNETKRMSVSLFNRKLLAKKSWLENPSKWPQVTYRVHESNKWYHGLEGLKYDYLESYMANWPLWWDLYALFDFSIVFQWIGHDFISDLRPPNKEILDMHFVIVHGLTPHAKFQNSRSKTIGPSEGQSWHAALQLPYLVTWPDLDFKISPEA